MKIAVKYYSTDGSSISKERCTQIIAVFNLCEYIGVKHITYKDIQVEAASQKIFGSVKTESVIRTIFPLLKKIGFVSYPNNDEFQANTFFTDLGKSFVKTLLALEKAKEIDNNEAILKIEQAREYHLCLGIVNLTQSSKNHNILLALEILKREKEIYWNDLLFHVSNIQQGISLNKSLELSAANRIKNERYEYVNEKNKPIANTAFSYVRSFLNEAGIISDSKSMYSRLNIDKLSFIQSLPLYEY